jgi:membrane protein YdbS with pleckstrin-like domain
LGGIGLRLFLLASVVLVLLRYYAYDPLSLTLSLLIFYVLNLVLEIYLLESKVTVKKQS